jgi:hypothetical protein
MARAAGPGRHKASVVSIFVLARGWSDPLATGLAGRAAHAKLAQSLAISAAMITVSSAITSQPHGG